MRPNVRMQDSPPPKLRVVFDRVNKGSEPKLGEVDMDAVRLMHRYLHPFERYFRFEARHMERIPKNWALTTAPESGPPYLGPSLILCGRQEAVTGFEDQFTLLPHYTRTTYAVGDVAGQKLQIEQPELLRAFVREWLLRVG